MLVDAHVRAVDPHFPEVQVRRQLLEHPLEDAFFAQRRKRWNTVFHLPNRGGRSRHGAPVRPIHGTASTKRRLSSPVRPASPSLPAHSGSIRFHWASPSIVRSTCIAIARLLASTHCHSDSSGTLCGSPKVPAAAAKGTRGTQPT